jgi:protein translocase SecG subunit
LQQGKGADLSVFGGGGTQAAFGARGAATLLHKLTVFAFVAFILTTILIGFTTGGGSSSVMSSVVTDEAVTEESAADPVSE